MKRAVAIKYDSEMPAPFLIAKERGELAERLLGIARKHGIEILYDESLAESLFYLETGSYIPESLYDAVATLLAYVYRTRSES